MIEQRCIILEPDPAFIDVVYVKVPSIYPITASLENKRALPKRMARLIKPAARALDNAMIEIAREGGTIFISDMFRSASDQARAHADYMSGRKSAYSPPPGGSMHEAARAIDIDTGHTGIGLARVKKIFKKHGIIGIAERGSECWHHDWRGPDGQAAYDAGGSGMSKYRAMARHCIDAIGNIHGKTDSENHEAMTRDLQKKLNRAINAGLIEDGIMGDQTRMAVAKFQSLHGLEVDSIAGPLTREALEQYIGKM